MLYLKKGVAMEFFELVKHVRTIQNISQKQLAQALNVSFATINRWENKKVTPSNLAQKTFYEFCEINLIDINSILNT